MIIRKVPVALVTSGLVVAMLIATSGTAFSSNVGGNGSPRTKNLKGGIQVRPTARVYVTVRVPTLVQETHKQDQGMDKQAGQRPRTNRKQLGTQHVLLHRAHLAVINYPYCHSATLPCRTKALCLSGTSGFPIVN